MSAPRLTVGIPTFNRAAWLGEAIESVLAQTFTDFRLIVSDNASDDDTPEVVRSFADERIEYVRSEHNVGSIGNCNRLVDLAETEFLVLLPDDDLLYPGHLQAAVEVLDRFEHVGLAHSAFDVIDMQSRVVERVDLLGSRSPVTIERDGRALERLMVAEWPMCFSSIVYRTEVLRAAGGFRAQEEPFCDFELWMRIAAEWDFAYLGQQLAGFRVHDGSVTTKVIAEHDATRHEREVTLTHAAMRFQRRTSFLEQAALGPRRGAQLRALAELQFALDRTRAGGARGEGAARAARLATRFPRLLGRLDLWRLVLAPGGVRSLLRSLGSRLTPAAIRATHAG